jgi:hypothetical protein
MHRLDIESEMNLKKDFQSLHVNRMILLKCVLKKQGMRVWSGFMWLRTGTSGGFL